MNASFFASFSLAACCLDAELLILPSLSLSLTPLFSSLPPADGVPLTPPLPTLNGLLLRARPVLASLTVDDRPINGDGDLAAAPAAIFPAEECEDTDGAGDLAAEESDLLDARRCCCRGVLLPPPPLPAAAAVACDLPWTGDRAPLLPPPAAALDSASTSSHVLVKSSSSAASGNFLEAAEYEEGDVGLCRAPDEFLLLMLVVLLLFTLPSLAISWRWWWLPALLRLAPPTPPPGLSLLLSTDLLLSPLPAAVGRPE